MANIQTFRGLREGVSKRPDCCEPTKPDDPFTGTGHKLSDETALPVATVMDRNVLRLARVDAIMRRIEADKKK